jgi:hypothetical protein
MAIQVISNLANLGRPDHVPAGKPPSGTVNIAAYNSGVHEGMTHSEKRTFEGRSNQIPARLHLHANTGDEFAAKLIEASRYGPITKVVVYSHSARDGLYLNNDQGLYTRDHLAEGSATLDDIREYIKSGAIKFAPNAVIIFLGCHTGQEDDYKNPTSFAAIFSTLVPHGTVIGASGLANPLPVEENGRKRDSNFYFTTGVWNFFRNGKRTDHRGQIFNPLSVEPENIKFNYNV